uniref:Uncharacterized protein n=1 Tax=Caenorhabditis japonica TaxID=281687 RepID=A0A8R1EVG2_CAEJA
MADQSEGGTVPNSDGIFGSEQFHMFQGKFLELCRPHIQAMARRTEEKSPELSQKGLQHQADLNTRLINKLKDALGDGHADTNILQTAVNETIEALKKRNSELALLDKNPGALKFTCFHAV